MRSQGQQTTRLMLLAPAPIDPGPDLVCRMAARSFAQARVQFDKDLNSGKHRGMATMAWMKTMAAANAPAASPPGPRRPDGENRRPAGVGLTAGR
eukprot:CAMPEP_0172178230 /NCGR_PEP_ID=MMETSP1050-20130122/15904_1 /TAXON_ID=233186 /ORGANISM="Cryptomonas curvata, Strain CCAP979/52" /LENGTH=94 /DNA_ID=CAMNT_0012850893 /DNA_START=492 /DNA_END=777 /DNA_ORIENTATION=-